MNVSPSAIFILNVAADICEAAARIIRGAVATADLVSTDPDFISKLRRQHPHLGARQNQVLQFLYTVGEDGATVRELKKVTTSNVGNTWTLLNKLCREGLIERIGTPPYRYRLTKTNLTSTDE